MFSMETKTRLGIYQCRVAGREHKRKDRQINIEMKYMHSSLNWVNIMLVDNHQIIFLGISLTKILFAKSPPTFTTHIISNMRALQVT